METESNDNDIESFEYYMPFIDYVISLDKHKFTKFREIKSWIVNRARHPKEVLIKMKQSISTQYKNLLIEDVKMPPEVTKLFCNIDSGIKFDTVDLCSDEEEGEIVNISTTSFNIKAVTTTEQNSSKNQRETMEKVSTSDGDDLVIVSVTNNTEKSDIASPNENVKEIENILEKIDMEFRMENSTESRNQILENQLTEERKEPKERHGRIHKKKKTKSKKLGQSSSTSDDDTDVEIFIPSERIVNKNNNITKIAKPKIIAYCELNSSSSDEKNMQEDVVKEHIKNRRNDATKTIVDSTHEVDPKIIECTDLPTTKETAGDSQLSNNEITVAHTSATEPRHMHSKKQNPDVSELAQLNAAELNTIYTNLNILNGFDLEQYLGVLLDSSCAVEQICEEDTNNETDVYTNIRCAPKDQSERVKLLCNNNSDLSKMKYCNPEPPECQTSHHFGSEHERTHSQPNIAQATVQHNKQLQRDCNPPNNMDIDPKCVDQWTPPPACSSRISSDMQKTTDYTMVSIPRPEKHVSEVQGKYSEQTNGPNTHNATYENLSLHASHPNLSGAYPTNIRQQPLPTLKLNLNDPRIRKHLKMLENSQHLSYGIRNNAAQLNLIIGQSQPSIQRQKPIANTPLTYGEYKKQREEAAQKKMAEEQRKIQERNATVESFQAESKDTSQRTHAPSKPTQQKSAQLTNMKENSKNIIERVKSAETRKIATTVETDTNMCDISTNLNNTLSTDNNIKKSATDAKDLPQHKKIDGIKVQKDLLQTKQDNAQRHRHEKKRKKSKKSERSAVDGRSTNSNESTKTDRRKERKTSEKNMRRVISKEVQDNTMLNDIIRKMSKETVLEENASESRSNKIKSSIPQNEPTEQLHIQTSLSSGTANQQVVEENGISHPRSKSRECSVEEKDKNRTKRELTKSSNLKSTKVLVKRMNTKDNRCAIVSDDLKMKIIKLPRQKENHIVERPITSSEPEAEQNLQQNDGRPVENSFKTADIASRVPQLPESKTSLANKPTKVERMLKELECTVIGYNDMKDYMPLARNGKRKCSVTASSAIFLQLNNRESSLGPSSNLPSRSRSRSKSPPLPALTSSKCMKRRKSVNVSKTNLAKRSKYDSNVSHEMFITKKPVVVLNRLSREDIAKYTSTFATSDNSSKALNVQLVEQTADIIPINTEPKTNAVMTMERPNIDCLMTTRNTKFCVLCKSKPHDLTNHYVRIHKTESYVARLTVQDIDELQFQINYAHKHKEFLNGEKFYTINCFFCSALLKDTFVNFHYHFSSHTGEYSFQCGKCGMKKPYRADIQSHIRHSKHCHLQRIQTLYSYSSSLMTIYLHCCKICNFVQLNAANVYKHLRDHHGKQSDEEQYVEKFILTTIANDNENNERDGETLKEKELYAEPCMQTSQKNSVLSELQVQPLSPVVVAAGIYNVEEKIDDLFANNKTHDVLSESPVCNISKTNCLKESSNNEEKQQPENVMPILHKPFQLTAADVLMNLEEVKLEICDVKEEQVQQEMPQASRTCAQQMNNARESYRSYKPNELYYGLHKCMAMDCRFSTDNDEVMIEHLEDHYRSDCPPCGYLECSYCTFTLKEGDPVVELVAHIHEKHAKNRFQCSLCCYRSLTPENAVFHMKHTHEHSDGPNQYKIFHCPGPLPDDDHAIMQKICEAMARHVSKIKCLFCSLEFYAIRRLQDHIAEAHPQHPASNINWHSHVCVYCGHSSGTIEEIEKHMASIHPDSFPFVCGRQLLIADRGDTLKNLALEKLNPPEGSFCLVEVEMNEQDNVLLHAADTELEPLACAENNERLCTAQRDSEAVDVKPSAEMLIEILEEAITRILNRITQNTGVPSELLFQCAVAECGGFFSTHELWRRHVEKKHNTSYTTCQHCQRQYNNTREYSLLEFKDHVITHCRHYFICGCCMATFITRELLQEHAIKMHSNITEWHLEKISSKFIVSYYVNMNMQDVQNVVRIGYLENLKNTLTEHVSVLNSTWDADLLTHWPLPPSTAPSLDIYPYSNFRKCFVTKCPYNSGDISEIIEHMRSNHEIARHRFQCFRCDTYIEVIENWEMLANHMKLHGCDNYVCCVCRYRTWSRSQLSQHIRAEHSCRDAPFVQLIRTIQTCKVAIAFVFATGKFTFSTILKCFCCSERFDSANTFVMHLKNYHKLALRYACELCNESFARLSTCPAHFAESHPKKPITIYAQLASSNQLILMDISPLSINLAKDLFVVKQEKEDTQYDDCIVLEDDDIVISEEDIRLNRQDSCSEAIPRIKCANMLSLLGAVEPLSSPQYLDKPETASGLKLAGAINTDTIPVPSNQQSIRTMANTRTPCNLNNNVQSSSVEQMQEQANIQQSERLQHSQPLHTNQQKLTQQHPQHIQNTPPPQSQQPQNLQRNIRHNHQVQGSHYFMGEQQIMERRAEPPNHQAKQLHTNFIPQRQSLHFHNYCTLPQQKEIRLQPQTHQRTDAQHQLQSNIHQQVQNTQYLQAPHQQRNTISHLPTQQQPNIAEQRYNTQHFQIQRFQQSIPVDPRLRHHQPMHNSYTSNQMERGLQPVHQQTHTTLQQHVAPTVLHTQQQLVYKPRDMQHQQTPQQTHKNFHYLQYIRKQ